MNPNVGDFTAVIKAHKYKGMNLVQKAAAVSMAAKLARSLSYAVIGKGLSTVAGVFGQAGDAGDGEEGPDPLDVAILLSEELGTRNIECAVGGSLALGIWSTPRATLDVDLNVYAQSHDQVDSLFQSLSVLGAVYLSEAHGQNPITLPEAREKSAKDAIIHCTINNIDCDLFLDRTAAQRASKRRKKAVVIRRRTVNFVDAETLACYKLVWQRPKDLVDLDMLFAAYFNRGDRLDVDYIRALLDAELLDDTHPAYLHLAQLSAKYDMNI